MKYTVVFEWPDGEEPAVSRADTWKGGRLCVVDFADVFDELRMLRNLADLCNEWEDDLPAQIQDALAMVRP